jgi:hypothetical protein
MNSAVATTHGKKRLIVGLSILGMLVLASDRYWIKFVKLLLRGGSKTRHERGDFCRSRGFWLWQVFGLSHGLLLKRAARSGISGRIPVGFHPRRRIGQGVGNDEKRGGEFAATV